MGLQWAEKRRKKQEFGQRRGYFKFREDLAVFFINFRVFNEFLISSLDLIKK
jgi:hypothetical protein